MREVKPCRTYPLLLAFGTIVALLVLPQKATRGSSQRVGKSYSEECLSLHPGVHLSNLEKDFSRFLKLNYKSQVEPEPPQLLRGDYPISDAMLRRSVVFEGQFRARVASLLATARGKANSSEAGGSNGERKGPLFRIKCFGGSMTKGREANYRFNTSIEGDEEKVSWVHRFARRLRELHPWLAIEETNLAKHSTTSLWLATSLNVLLPPSEPVDLVVLDYGVNDEFTHDALEGRGGNKGKAKQEAANLLRGALKAVLRNLLHRTSALDGGAPAVVVLNTINRPAHSDVGDGGRGRRLVRAKRDAFDSFVQPAYLMACLDFGVPLVSVRDAMAASFETHHNRSWPLFFNWQFENENQYSFGGHAGFISHHLIGDLLSYIWIMGAKPICDANYLPAPLPPPPVALRDSDLKIDNRGHIAADGTVECGLVVEAVMPAGSAGVAAEGRESIHQPLHGGRVAEEGSVWWYGEDRKGKPGWIANKTMGLTHGKGRPLAEESLVVKSVVSGGIIVDTNLLRFQLVCSLGTRIHLEYLKSYEGMGNASVAVLCVNENDGSCDPKLHGKGFSLSGTWMQRVSLSHFTSFACPITQGHLKPVTVDVGFSQTGKFKVLGLIVC